MARWGHGCRSEGSEVDTVGGGGGGGGGLLVYIYTAEGLTHLPGLGATHPLRYKMAYCDSCTHVSTHLPSIVLGCDMNSLGLQLDPCARRAGRKAATSGTQPCCWHPEGAREVAVAPTAAAQGGGRGRLHRKNQREWTGGGGGGGGE